MQDYEPKEGMRSSVTSENVLQAPQMPEVQRTSWDVAVGLSQWLRAKQMPIFVVLVVVGGYFFVGWYLSASIVVGYAVWYFILNKIVRDNASVYVARASPEDSSFAVFEYGSGRFQNLKMKGDPYTFHAGDGRPVYLAEEAGSDEIKFSWIHAVSRWKFLFTFQAHTRLVEILDNTLFEYLKIRNYPRTCGIGWASEFLKVWEGKMDSDDLTLDIDSDEHKARRESVESWFTMAPKVDYQQFTETPKEVENDANNSTDKAMVEG